MTHDGQPSGVTSGAISGLATTSGDGEQESLFNNTIHLLDFLSQLIINQDQPVNNNKNNTGCETWILKYLLGVFLCSLKG